MISHPAIVILAGGMASRMKRGIDALTDSSLADEIRRKNKAMLGVGPDARPFLDVLIHNVERAGFRSVVIVVGESDTFTPRYYSSRKDEGEFPAITISCVVQRVPPGRDKPLGTADALLAALDGYPELSHKPFAVCNSDNLYSVEALQSLLSDSHPNAMLGYDTRALRFPEDRLRSFAVIQTDDQRFLTEIVEKPSPSEYTSNDTLHLEVSMNIFRFTHRDIIHFLRSVPLHPERNEKELPNAVRLMIQSRPRSMFVIPRAEHVPDLTSPKDIPDVVSYLRDHGYSSKDRST